METANCSCPEVSILKSPPFLAHGNIVQRVHTQLPLSLHLLQHKQKASDRNLHLILECNNATDLLKKKDFPCDQKTSTCLTGLALKLMFCACQKEMSLCFCIPAGFSHPTKMLCSLVLGCPHACCLQNTCSADCCHLEKTLRK